jgi:hypothetical protein
VAAADIHKEDMRRCNGNFSTTAHAYAASWSPLFRQACGVCVCSFGRRQKSSTLRHTLANECHHLELCLLLAEEEEEQQQLRQHIETIVHRRSDYLLAVAIAVEM